MRKYTAFVVIMSLFISHQAFSNTAALNSNANQNVSKQCEPIANACLNAGFKESGGLRKAFWYDCMKPILLGKKVEGVTVDAKEVKMCRQAKIVDLNKFLRELQKAQ